MNASHRQRNPPQQKRVGLVDMDTGEIEPIALANTATNNTSQPQIAVLHLPPGKTVTTRSNRRSRLDKGDDQFTMVYTHPHQQLLKERGLNPMEGSILLHILSCSGKRKGTKRLSE